MGLIVFQQSFSGFDGKSSLYDCLYFRLVLCHFEAEKQHQNNWPIDLPPAFKKPIFYCC